MNNLRVIIKPKGLIALTVLITAVMVGITAPQWRNRSEASKDKPVGGPGAPSPLSREEEIPDAGEREESGMLSNWNKTPGQARDWLFLGPLTSGSRIAVTVNEATSQAAMDRIINTVYLPDEAKYQAKENASFNLNGKIFSWRKVNGSSFDFKDMFKTPEAPRSSLKNMVVYGVSYIDSPKAVKKNLHLRSDDGAIVWLNGTQVFKITKIRGVRDEENVIPITLRPGKNTLLIKVGQGDGGWGMMVHLKDAGGAS
jgi:hypothetical protein